MEKAYLRELHQTNQCELVFNLKLTDNHGKILIMQEIHAVRGITDTVQAMLDHIKRKINKMLDLKDIPKLEITISLTGSVDSKSDVSLKTFIERSKKCLITICKQTFEVAINAPLVQLITLPSVSYVNYSVQPLKFKTIHTDKRLSEFIWYTSKDQKTWTEIGYKYKYKPRPNDRDCYLKLRCIPKNNHSEGPPYEVISKMTIKNMVCIPECPFEERHKYTETGLSQKDLRVVSYNTLSNIYIDTQGIFEYCTPQALSIDYRKQLILKELMGYNADIICLQEVDYNIFLNYLKPKLRKTYQGVFHKKGYRIAEGLACFFNIDRFKLLESKQLVFCSELRTNALFKRTWNLVKHCDTVKDCIIKQPTSLQITILKSKELNEVIVVANTHLYYHSKASNVRLLQSSIALEYIKDVCNKYKRSKKSRVSVIFCGDFNSTPSSAVYNLIAKGVVQHSFEQEKETPIENICLSHPFQFASAYGTPKYTNYTEDFKDCLDYIFYEKNNFVVTKCVPLPDEEVLSANVALPSEVFPSDHLALIADLQWQ